MELNKKLTAASVIIAVAAVLLFLGLVDPVQSKWVPRCFFKFATGYDCPGCGSQRAIHALLHGHVADAWHYNALLIAALPFMIFLLTVTLNRHRWPRLYTRITSNTVIYITLALILVWTLLRNLIGI